MRHCLRAALFLPLMALGASAAEPPAHQSRLSLNSPFDWISEQQSKLDDAGLSLFFDYWGVFLANPVGGAAQGAAYNHLIIFGGELDLEKTLGWKGGAIGISAADVAGSNLSNRVGNIFILSQAYVMNSFALYDLYLKQKLLDDKLELRAGRLAAGQFFAALPAFGLQVNSAVNGNPTPLFLNAPFTASPNANWALYANYTEPAYYAQAGVFQASPRMTQTAYHGLDFSIRRDNGFLSMAEIGWTPAFGATGARTSGDGKKAAAMPANPGLPGTYQFGGYYSYYTFENFHGGAQHNAYGFYLQGQQMIWRSAANENISFSLWGGATYSPQYQFALMPLMGYCGTVWQGVIPGRDQDQFLFSAYFGGFSSDYADTVAAGVGGARPTVETVLEWSYVIQLNKNLQFQPDLQYVIQPNGQRSIPNAFVLGFQISASF